MPLRFAGLAGFVAAAAVFGSAASAQGLGRIEPGEPFPDLLLPAMEDGEPTSIADLRGRKVVLHVFASW